MNTGPHGPFNYPGFLRVWEVWVTSQRLGGTRVAFLHARTPTHSPPDVETGRGTPSSLYTLLYLCMSLFCLLRVLLFALGRLLTWLDLSAVSYGAWRGWRPRSKFYHCCRRERSLQFLFLIFLLWCVVHGAFGLNGNVMRFASAPREYHLG